MKKLEKAVQNREKPKLTEDRGNKSRVLSLRINAQIEQVLEEQAKAWNLSISDTVRSILNFYFLPIAYLKLWNEKATELEAIDKKSFGISRADESAKTLAERIKPLLVDTEEAEEYATFIFDLIQESSVAFRELIDEGVLMGEIASDMLLRMANAYQDMKGKLPEDYVMQEQEAMVEVLEEMTV